MPVIQRDFGELYARGLGEGDESVVLLHEYFGTHQSWAAQTAAFARTHRVLAPDLRGHGRSPVPSGHRIAVSEIAEDIRALRETYGLGACHFVGCSLGAVVAMYMAIHEPTSVRSLTIASVPSLTSPEATAYARTYIEQIVPRIEPNLDRMHGSGEAGYTRSVLLRNFAADLDEMPPDHVETTGSARRISAPTLVICGENDPVFAPRTTLAMAELMPNASLAVLPAAGHLVHQEFPGIFNSLVVDHLLRASRNRGEVSA